MTKILKLHLVNISLVTLAAIFCQFFPLLNVTSYEFSALFGVLVAISAGVYSIKMSNNNPDFGLKDFIFSSQSFKFFVVIIFLPLVPSLVSTIFIEQCPILEGVSFYFLFVIPSLLLGHMVAIVSSILTSKFRYLLFGMLIVLLLLLPIIEIYLNPQIYLYNSLYGFFPGTMYDEDIAINSTLIFFRIAVFLFALLSLVCIKKAKNRGTKLIRVVGIGLLGLSLFYLKPDIGLATSLPVMEKKLGRKLETDNFKIVYSKDIDSTQLLNLSLHHEYYAYNLLEQLNDTLKGKITSIVFKNGDQKRLLFGAKNADVAKPWLNQIYTNWEHYDVSLKHEIAHILSAPYGVTSFRVAKNFNPAMIEGWAMALEDNYNDQEIHTVAKNAYDSGYKISIKELFNSFNFFSVNPSISYVYAGSFIKYLLDKYGPEPLKKVYSNLDFELNYGMSIDSLEHDYFAFLNRIKSKKNEAKANLYFGRKPIFKKYCVRYTANEIKRAWKIYNSGAYPEAVEKFEELYFYSGSYSAFLGQILSLQNLKKYKEAENLIEEELLIFEKTSYYNNLILLLSGLKAINKKFNEADSLYNFLLNNAPNIEYENAAKTRLIMLKDSCLSEYLLSSNKQKAEILNSYFSKDKKLEFITPLISFYYSNNEDYINFIDKFNNVVFDSTYLAAYSVFELSKISKDNYDYSTAEKYLAYSLRYKDDPGFTFIINQYKQKLEWIKDNFNRIKNSIRYTR